MKKKFETQILRLNSSGQGIGQYEGLVTFIDLALPNETIEAELLLQKKNYALAEMTRLIHPSSSRVEPICPIFKSCGGCQIMHLDYQEQLKYKTLKVQDALKRIAQIECEVFHCIPSSPLHYRNKICLPFFEKEGYPSLGFYKKRSHEIVEVNTCYIHHPLGQKIFDSLKELLKSSKLSVYNEKTHKGFLRHLLIRSTHASHQCLLTFITFNQKETALLKELASALIKKHPEIVGVIQNINPAQSNVILGPIFKTLLGVDTLTENMLGYTFKIAADAFFQVNTLQAEKLYQSALDWAELSSEDIVLDAYCGIGMFSIFAHKQVQKVIGIECVKAAIENAKENAKLNHAENLHFICSTVEKEIHSIENLSCVFINPPRKGCDASVIEALIEKKPDKILYISCDPATLSRDLKKLTEKTYELIKVQPFDMFPQTTHVETLVLLKRKD